MNKAALLKAMEHPDKLSEASARRALSAAGNELEKKEKAAASLRENLASLGKTGLHMAERTGSLVVASAAKGAIGTASIGGVDVRLATGIITVGTGLYQKVANPKKTRGDHIIAFGEGLLYSFMGDKAQEVGKAGRAKWDARGQGSQVAGNAPQVAGTPTRRDVLLSPPVDFDDEDFAGERRQRNARRERDGLTYADLV